MAHSRLFAGLLTLLLVSPWLHAQLSADAELEQTDTLIVEFEQRLERGAPDLEQLNRWQTAIDRRHRQLLTLREQTLEELRRFDEQLAALGPAPGEDDPPEAPSVASQRRDLEAQRNPLLGTISRADVLLVALENLAEKLSENRTSRQKEATLERQPALLSATFWPALRAELRALAGRFSGAGPAFGVLLGSVCAALVTLLVVRRAALRWLRHGPADARVTQFFNAPAQAGLWLYTAAIVPFLAAAGTAWLTLWLTPTGGDQRVPLNAALTALLTTLLIRELAVALLRPYATGHRPPLAPASTARLRRRIHWIAVWAGTVLLLYGLHDRRLPHLHQLAQFGLQSLLAASAVGAIQSLLVAFAAGAAEPAGAHVFERRRRAARRTLLTALLGAAAIGATVNPLLIAAGYSMLAERLFFGSLGTVLLLPSAWLTHHLTAALLDLSLNHWLRPLAIVYLQRRYTPRLRRLIRLALLAGTDLALLAALVAGLAWCWQLDLSVLKLSLQRLLAGVQIGQLRLTPTAVVAALAVLLLVLSFTRLIRRLVANQVLVHTRLDAGLQAALLAGINAAGVVLAAALTMTVLGVALADLVLVLGGLAIGVGFGLQHIVNNVVSGIVLLLERPLKPGDWVVVNDREGTVERVGLRATEITTLNLASVLIPNAELISGSVTNWSLRDPSVVIDITLTVEIDSDDETVSNALYDSAREHPLVLAEPAPEVLLKRFSERGLDYELSVYVRHLNQQWRVASDLHRAVLGRLRAAGIRLAVYPSRF